MQNMRARCVRPQPGEINFTRYARRSDVLAVAACLIVVGYLVHDIGGRLPLLHETANFQNRAHIPVYSAHRL